MAGASAAGEVPADCSLAGVVAADHHGACVWDFGAEARVGGTLICRCFICTDPGVCNCTDPGVVGVVNEDCGCEFLPGVVPRAANAASAAGCIGVVDTCGCWIFNRANVVACRVTGFKDCNDDCGVVLCFCAGDAGVSDGLVCAKALQAGAVTCRLTGRVDRAVTVGDAGEPSDGGYDQEAGADAAAPDELPPAEANPDEG